MAAAKEGSVQRASSKMSTVQVMPTLPGAGEDTYRLAIKAENASETERTDTPMDTLERPVICEVCGGQCPASGLCMASVEVATGWMLDFVFCCMCQHFKQQHTEDFERSRDAMEALLQGLHKLEFQQLKAVRLCQFLSRVAEGRNLDAQFEKDDKITPLEAASMIWKSIEGEPGSFGNLHEEIQLLVQVQAVSVCIEKGQYMQATEVLERLFGREDSNKSIQMKLSMIISKKDPYHRILQGFTYEQMLNKITSFIDIFLSERPKNFLLKVAARVVEASRVPPVAQCDETKNDIAAESEINCEKKKRCSSSDYVSTSNLKKESDLIEKKDTNDNESKDVQYLRKNKKRLHAAQNIMEESSFETELLKNDYQLRDHKRLISTEVKKESSQEQQCSFKNLSAKSKKHDRRSRKSWRELKKEYSPCENRRRRVCYFSRNVQFLEATRRRTTEERCERIWSRELASNSYSLQLR
ncbi:telomeric repeat-binding factor 1 isoform X2 [Lissotriton helveticus]